MERIINNGAEYQKSANARRLIEVLPPQENQDAVGKSHACKAYQRGLQDASEHLKRANRDLGETAAFIAASLSTVTAVEAVINIAFDRLGLSRDILQLAFNVYLVVFALIFLWGAISARSAIRRRSQAEKEMDQARKGIFEFCPVDQWAKPDES